MSFSITRDVKCSKNRFLFSLSLWQRSCFCDKFHQHKRFLLPVRNEFTDSFEAPVFTVFYRWRRFSLKRHKFLALFLFTWSMSNALTLRDCREVCFVTCSCCSLDNGWRASAAASGDKNWVRKNSWMEQNQDRTISSTSTVVPILLESETSDANNVNWSTIKHSPWIWR